jgi:hypothetical protein
MRRKADHAPDVAFCLFLNRHEAPDGRFWQALTFLNWRKQLLVWPSNANSFGAGHLPGLSPPPPLR